MDMQIRNNNILAAEIQKITPVKTGPAARDIGASGAGQSFNQILQETIENRQPLQFSKHANMRLNTRDIRLSDSQLKRVEDAVTQAKVKGVRDSLVLVDDVALVVNVQNKVVITALNKNQAGDHVFTNIDGAVIV